MAWLRVDDGLAEHRKLLNLTRGERWTWMELLCHVARRNNGGHVSEGVSTTMKYVTPKFLEKCKTLGLLDTDPANGELVVHDWAIYNGGTVAERVAAFLGSNPDASANEVVVGIGGNRKLVLAEVHRQTGDSP